MNKFALGLLTTGALLLSAPTAWAQDPSSKPADPKPTAKKPTETKPDAKKKTTAKKAKKSGRKVTAENATMGKFKAYTVGEKMIYDRFFAAQMSISIGAPGQPAQNMDNDQSIKEKRQLTFTKAKEGKINQLELHFLARRETRENKGGPAGMMPKDDKDKKDPYEGRTFVMDYDGNEVKINEKNAKDDGKNDGMGDFRMGLMAKKEESTFKSLEGGLSKAIPNRELKVGENFVCDEDSMRNVLDMNDDEFKFEKRQLTYKGTTMVGKTKAAVFDVTIVGKGEQKNGFGPKMLLTIKGQLCVDLSNKRDLEFEFKGDLKFEPGKANPNGPQMTFEGKGKIEGLIIFVHLAGKK